MGGSAGGRYSRGSGDYQAPRTGSRVPPSVPKPSNPRSIETQRIQHLISEGECVGLVDATNPAKSVFFTGTPLQNADNSFNFEGVQIEQRYGTSTQAFVAGFPGVEADVTVNTEVVQGTPITRTVSSINIDAVRVAIQFPLGLSRTDAESGAQLSTTVQINILRKLTSSGSWETVISGYDISGPAQQGYEMSFFVPRNPAWAAALWDVKVERLTATTTSPNFVADKSYFYRMTEIQDVKQTYPNSAYVSLAYDSKNAPNPFPQTFDWIGLKVQVPSNYNAVSRVYTGVWNGSMSATYTWSFNTTTRMWDRTYTGTIHWTDNPVWHLYELLINKRWGFGIDPATIDKASFYSAAVYCDELVDDGDGGTEPRFTYNCQITNMEDGWKVVQMLASTFNAAVYVGNGLVRLVQDRPTSTYVLITKANIHEDGFNYSSSAASVRHTAAAVTFNDPNDGFRQRKIIEWDQSTTLPYNVTDVVAWGCTTEGQARRAARWHTDTELRNTDVVTYKAPLNHVNVNPGSIIKVMDSDFANSMLHAKVVSVSGTTVNLDRQVTVTSGTNYIDVLLEDGLTVQQKAITTSSGSHSALTVASAFSQAVLPGADAIITGAVVPRLFRVTDIKESEEGFYEVVALQYDPAKYARVETGVSVSPQVYSDTTVSSIPGAVTAIAFVLQAATAVDTVYRDLAVSWTPSTGATSFTLQWRLRGKEWNTVDGIGTAMYTIEDVVSGTYDVNVYAINKWGQQSPVTSSSYGVDLSGTTTIQITAPTSLQIYGSTGTAFTSPDLSVEWTNPIGNAGKNPALKDFVVKVYTSGGTLLRTDTVAGVPAGSKASYTYSLDKNLADGGPRRDVRIDVHGRDGVNNVTSATTATFTNAAPATLSGLAVSSAISNIKITYTLPTEADFKGILVWRSTTSGFTPSAGNFLLDTTANYITDPVAFGTTYYYKLAAYDTFSKPLDGAGLNLTAQQSASALEGDGIPEVDELPDPSGYTGPRIVFLTTNGQLYSLIDGVWTLTIPPVSDIIDGGVTIAKFAAGLRPLEIVTSLPTTDNVEGRQVYLTTDDKIYRYNGSTFTTAVAATDLVGTINASNIADGSLAGTKFASSIQPTTIVTAVPGTLSTRMIFNTTDGKLYKWNGSAYTAAITGFTDLSGIIANSQISAGTIGADKLVANSITTLQITANGVNGDRILTNSLDAGKIIAASITTTQLQANGVNADRLVAGSMTTDRFTSNSIAGTIITTGSLAADKIIANSITGGQIQAGAIGATEIASNAIRTDKLFVTGRGKALNDDPSCMDSTAWSVGAGSIAISADTTLPVGTSKIRCTNGTQLFSRSFAVEAGKTYKVSLYAKQISGGGVIYIRQYCYSAGGTLISYVVTGLTPTTGALEGLTVPSTWTRYTGFITPAATSVYAQVYIHANWNTTGVTDLCDIRSEEYIGADLIVDGSIVTSKLAAGSVDTNALAANAVTAGKVQASSINASHVVANSLTGDRFVANTITGDRVAANTITVTNIDSRNLTIKDAAGTVIFSAGVPLTAAYADSALRNSSVSISSSGVLSGAGGGTVTVAGLDNSIIRSANPITSGNISTYIAAAAIGTAQIASAAIGTAQIGDLSVTNAKIANLAVDTAKIGDLQVSTLKIANNAVTIPVLATSTTVTNGPLTPTGTGGGQANSRSFEIMSSTFTSTGAPIKADFVAEVAFSTVGSASYVSAVAYTGQILIKLDGTTISTVLVAGETLAVGTAGTYDYVAIPWKPFTTSAGTHTISMVFEYWRVAGTPTNGQVFGTVRERGVLTTETLK